MPIGTEAAAQDMGLGKIPMKLKQARYMDCKFIQIRPKYENI